MPIFGLYHSLNCIQNYKKKKYLLSFNISFIFRMIKNIQMKYSINFQQYYYKKTMLLVL
jgi:hypothetical protein